MSVAQCKKEFTTYFLGRGGLGTGIQTPNLKYKVTVTTLNLTLKDTNERNKKFCLWMGFEPGRSNVENLNDSKRVYSLRYWCLYDAEISGT